MKDRITPEHITVLMDNEIFVFGSNLSGFHGAGAAKTALQWGAIGGLGSGISGNTYAIPTKNCSVRTMNLLHIKLYVDQFLAIAEIMRPWKFMVTEIGCGLAGYTPEDIAPLFERAVTMPNVYLPQRFWDVLNKKQEILEMLG